MLTQAQVKAVLTELTGVHYLLAALLYGSGLRRIEAVRLRVKVRLRLDARRIG